MWKCYIIIMKKLTFYISSLVLLLVLTGCHDTKHYKLGVSQCSDDDWRRKMNAEIEREIMFHPEMIVEIRSADDSNEKQIEDIRYFIENGFDAIAVAPNEAEALTPIITEAYEAGIPVIVFDRNTDNHSYTAWQGADNVALGRSAADLVVEMVGKNAKTIEIRGLKGSTPTNERHRGFISNPDVNIVGEGFGDWNYDMGYKVADSLLRLNPDTRVIYAHNDRMAIAASDVARKLGVSPYILGIDGAPEIGMKAVADSLINATFIYPTEGKRLIQTASAILLGQPYDTLTILPRAAAILPSNVDALLLQNQEVKNETESMVRLKKELDDYWARYSFQTSFLYATIIIMVLLAGVLFLLLRTFWQHRRHQAQLNEAISSKLAFFTNVSHDLRTPLTLIAEPVEQMAYANNITDSQRALMKIADKNIKILKRLINQILDFRKYEHGKLELHPSRMDFSQLITAWTEAFEGLARRRDIAFTLEIEPDRDYVTGVDVEKMERVYYNLVSNAFKYSPDNSSISIRLSREGDNIVFSVSDTGKGISPEDLPVIFDRFFQADRILPSGSGIGLALAKAFVELHNGTITVESVPGKGSKFEVKFPVTQADVKEGEIKRYITADLIDAENAITPVSAVTATPEENKDKATVLVIDDNPDIMALITALLSEEYTVISAEDGVVGLRKAAKYVPDVIICDVMMPNMDGIECCRRLKSEITTSHIPVLMLTACAMDEQRVDGYEVGADGYLSKPFSSAVLKARLRNLILNRKLIRDVLHKDSIIVKADTPAAPAKKASVSGAPDIDNEFYNKFIALVSKELGNAELNVEDLASEMGLGRSQFYRKIKSLTNYSPVELLRRLRMNRAHELLTSTEKTISEIAYEVGFSTPAYFTKCYRDTYNETPSETRERLGAR